MRALTRHPRETEGPLYRLNQSWVRLSQADAVVRNPSQNGCSSDSVPRYIRP